jgi:WD40 repeat protein
LVFLSYARADLDFAEQLAFGLKARGFAVTLDRHAIAGGEEWRTRLQTLVAECDTVVFVLTPDSARSKVCDEEIALANALSKRVLTAKAKPLGDAPVPAGLRSQQFIFFHADEKNPGKGPLTGLSELEAALRTDLDWVRRHTRIAQRAEEWDRADRAPDRLAQGGELREMLDWRARKPAAAPEITDLQNIYLNESERAEEVRTNAGRRRNRQVLMGVVAAGLVVLAFAALTVLQALGNAAALGKFFAELADQRIAAHEFASAMRFGLAGVATGSGEVIGPDDDVAAQKVEDAHFQNRLVRTLNAEGAGPIAALAFSPDAAILVVGYQDGQAALFDGRTGERRRSWKAHASGIAAIAFAPDGGSVATASADDAAKLWDARTGDLLRRMEGHGDDVAAIAFSPDGSFLVTGSRDKTARIWDAKSGAVSTILRGHGFAVQTVAIAPDAKRIATGSIDGEARIWDVAGGEALHAIRVNATGVRHLGFSPLGEILLAAGYARIVQTWDIATGEPRAALEGHSGAVNSARFSNSGGTIITGSGDGSVRIWDAASGTHRETFDGRGGAVLDAAYSSSDRRIAAAFADGALRIWDAETRTLIATMPGAPAAGIAMAVAQSGRIALAWEHGGARLWDGGFLGIRHRLTGANDALWSPRVSPDGSAIIAVSQNHTVHVWNARDGRPVAALASKGERVTTAEFSPDARQIVTAEGRIARLWDAKSGKETGGLAGHQDDIVTARFSPSGSRILTASLDDSAMVWDVQSRKPLFALKGHKDGLFDARFSPDGRWIATASSDGTAKVWRADTGAQAATLTGHTGVVTSVQFSPDGQAILTTATGGAAKLWDAGTFQARGGLGEKSMDVGEAAFSPDGRWIAGFDAKSAHLIVWETASGHMHRTFETGVQISSLREDAFAFSRDGRTLIFASPESDSAIRLWDIETGAQRTVLYGHHFGTTGAQFAPGGTQLVSAAIDGTAIVWDLSQFFAGTRASRIAAACARLKAMDEDTFTGGERAKPILAGRSLSPCRRPGLFSWLR